MRLLLWFVFLFITNIPLHAQNESSSNRKVAITMDDLPTVSLLNTPSQKKAITTKILGALRSKQAPAIGFVNEVKLFNGGKCRYSTSCLAELMAGSWNGAGKSYLFAFKLS